MGKLFYYIAVAVVDGKVQLAERMSLQRLIQNNWGPLEDSVDEFGTDQSVLIDSSFDYEESESFTDDGLQAFEELTKKARQNSQLILSEIY